MSLSTKTKVGEILLVLSIFVGAVLFRLWFMSLSPQPFWWDQQEYENYAIKMLHDPYLIAANSYRPYPWPLFMAILYLTFGIGNHAPIFIANALMDGLTTVVIYLILSKTTRTTAIARFGSILYAFNPFTSGYVGLALSEVMSACVMTVTVACGLWFIKRPSILAGVLLGVFAGLSAEVRSASFIWALIPMVLTAWFVHIGRHTREYIAIGFGVLLTVLYPLYANWRDFHEINITTVDSITAREFFNGAILTILPPFTNWYPQEVQDMYHEYYSEFYPGRTTAERKAMAQKYYRKGWDIVRANPVEYIRWRFFKMWYVWQKENIFFIREPGYTDHRLFTYYGNLLLLATSVLGLGIGITRFGTNGGRYLFWTIFLTVCYVTISFSITHAEYRLTIPFYPFLYMCSSVGVMAIISTVSASGISRKDPTTS